MAAFDEVVSKKATELRAGEGSLPQSGGWSSSACDAAPEEIVEEPPSEPEFVSQYGTEAEPIEGMMHKGSKVSDENCYTPCPPSGFQAGPRMDACVWRVCRRACGDVLQNIALVDALYVYKTVLHISHMI